MGVRFTAQGGGLYVHPLQYLVSVISGVFVLNHRCEPYDTIHDTCEQQSTVIDEGLCKGRRRERYARQEDAHEKHLAMTSETLIEVRGREDHVLDLSGFLWS